MKGLATELSSREMQVTEMVAWGLTEKEIANKLFVSPLTVNTHKKHIYRELGICKDTDLTRWYFFKEYGISAANPFIKAAVGAFFLAVSVFSIMESHELLRVFRPTNMTARSITVRSNRSSRGRRKDVYYLDEIEA